MSDIPAIATTDPTAYKQALTSELENKSTTLNQECQDPNAVKIDQLFQKTTQAIYVDLCSMDTGYLTSSLNIINKVYQEFPQAISGVNSFSILQLDQGMYGGFQPKQLDTGSSISTVYSDLSLSSLMFTTQNIDKPKKYYQQDLAQNFHPKNTDYTYVYAHEIGHDMEYLLTLKEIGVKDLLASTNPDDYYKFVELWNKYTVSGRIIKEAVANAQAKQVSLGQKPKTEEEMIEDISGYAAEKNDDGQTMYPETLAEAVSDYIANGNNSSELTLEIIPILNREMAKL
jgi:hypothetical protein